jgi:hypothetical protein
VLEVNHGVMTICKYQETENNSLSTSTYLLYKMIPTYGRRVARGKEKN